MEGLGGDGLVLAATLGREYFRYDEKAKALVGDDSGETFRQGQKIELKLVEANPASGSLRFELPQGGVQAPSRDGQRRDRVRGGAARGGPSKRGRPANIRHQGGKR